MRRGTFAERISELNEAVTLIVEPLRVWPRLLGPSRSRRPEIRVASRDTARRVFGIVVLVRTMDVGRSQAACRRAVQVAFVP